MLGTEGQEGLQDTWMWVMDMFTTSTGDVFTAYMDVQTYQMCVVCRMSFIHQLSGFENFYRTIEFPFSNYPLCTLSSHTLLSTQAPSLLELRGSTQPSGQALALRPGFCTCWEVTSLFSLLLPTPELRSLLQEPALCLGASLPCLLGALGQICSRPNHSMVNSCLGHCETINPKGGSEPFSVPRPPLTAS